VKQTGRTVVLVFMFGMVTPYFLIGGLFQKYRRGAEGRELLVHRSFWSGVPSLVADGCRFTLMKLTSGRLGAGISGNYDSVD